MQRQGGAYLGLVARRPAVDAGQGGQLGGRVAGQLGRLGRHVQCLPHLPRTQPQLHDEVQRGGGRRLQLLGALDGRPNELVLVGQLLELLRFQSHVRQREVRIRVVRARGHRLEIQAVK